MAANDWTINEDAIDAHFETLTIDNYDLDPNSLGCESDILF